MKYLVTICPKLPQCHFPTLRLNGWEIKDSPPDDIGEPCHWSAQVNIRLSEQTPV